MVTIRNTIDSFGYGATGWIDVEADGLIAGNAGSHKVPG